MTRRGTRSGIEEDGLARQLVAQRLVSGETTHRDRNRTQAHLAAPTGRGRRAVQVVVRLFRPWMDSRLRSPRSIATRAIDLSKGKSAVRIHRKLFTSNDPFERILVDTAVVPDPTAVNWINPRLAPGETRRALTGIPGKTGVVYTCDRATGEFLWAPPTVTRNVISAIEWATGDVIEGRRRSRWKPTTGGPDGARDRGDVSGLWGRRPDPCGHRGWGHAAPPTVQRDTASEGDRMTLHLVVAQLLPRAHRTG